MNKQKNTTRVISDKTSFIIFSMEQKWIDLIKRLAEKYPYEIIIESIIYDDITNKEYSIMASVPKKYFKVLHLSKANTTKGDKWYGNNKLRMPEKRYCISA